MGDIVLKDRNGNSIEYPGVNHIKVKTTDGATRDFVDSETVPEVVENLPIALDFSGGNQEIVAPDGVVVKSAVIQQPANLIPANIVEGVYIAGIIGAFAAGGGGGAYATGIFTGADAPATVEHGLGVVPDIVAVFATYGSFSSTDRLFWAYAVSERIGKIHYAGSATSYGYYYCRSTSGIGTSGSQSVPINNASAGMGRAIFGATETSFIVGPSGFYQRPGDGITYTWLAIGGLT